MIKQEAIFKKVGFILEELNEQYQFLAQNAEKFGDLELDLFLANANFLADHIQIIKKIMLNQSTSNSLVNDDLEFENQNSVSDDLQEQTENQSLTFMEETELENELPEIEIIKEEDNVSNFEEIEEEIFKLDHTPSTFEFILNDHSERKTIMDKPQTNTDEKFEFEEKSVDEIFNRPLSGEEERIIAEKKKLSTDFIQEQEEEEEEVGPEPFLMVKEEIVPIVEEDLTLELASVPPPLVQSDELVEDPSNKPTLNELLAGKNKSNATHIEKPLITDLKKAINLNDKLLYIKDLFNGYNLAYNEAIEIANKLPNYEAADNFFQKNYAVKNNWAEKQTTVAQFYELLNQRFK